MQGPVLSHQPGEMQSITCLFLMSRTGYCYSIGDLLPLEKIGSVSAKGAVESNKEHWIASCEDSVECQLKKNEEEEEEEEKKPIC